MFLIFCGGGVENMPLFSSRTAEIVSFFRLFLESYDTYYYHCEYGILQSVYGTDAPRAAWKWKQLMTTHLLDSANYLLKSPRIFVAGKRKSPSCIYFGSSTMLFA